MHNGRKTRVEIRFAIDSQGAAGFMIGDYDLSLPLIIDPVLAYSGFLGGSSADAANAIAIDSTGAAYVAGFTESYDLPALNANQTASGGGNDAFVAKLSASGNALVYCTYLGGSGDDRAFGTAVDSAGAAYVTGPTQSPNFPVRNAFQANLASAKNAFVVKLTPSGNNLAYSTYLGGNSSDAANGIAIDSSGNVVYRGGYNLLEFSSQFISRGLPWGTRCVCREAECGGERPRLRHLPGWRQFRSSGAAFVTRSITSLRLWRRLVQRARCCTLPTSAARGWSRQRNSRGSEQLYLCRRRHLFCRFSDHRRRSVLPRRRGQLGCVRRENRARGGGSVALTAYACGVLRYYVRSMESAVLQANPKSNLLGGIRSRIYADIGDLGLPASFKRHLPGPKVVCGFRRGLSYSAWQENTAGKWWYSLGEQNSDSSLQARVGAEGLPSITKYRTIQPIPGIQTYGA